MLPGSWEPQLARCCMRGAVARLHVECGAIGVQALLGLKKGGCVVRMPTHFPLHSSSARSAAASLRSGHMSCSSATCNSKHRSTARVGIWLQAAMLY